MKTTLLLGTALALGALAGCQSLGTSSRGPVRVQHNNGHVFVTVADQRLGTAAAAGDVAMRHACEAVRRKRQRLFAVMVFRTEMQTVQTVTRAGTITCRTIENGQCVGPMSVPDEVGNAPVATAYLDAFPVSRDEDVRTFGALHQIVDATRCEVVSRPG